MDGIGKKSMVAKFSNSPSCFIMNPPSIFRTRSSQQLIETVQSSTTKKERSLSGKSGKGRYKTDRQAMMGFKTQHRFYDYTQA